MKILARNNVDIKSVAEIGCGAGVILQELSESKLLGDADFHGYDISPDAIQLCEPVRSERINFTCDDLLSDKFDLKKFDLLLAIDVFEHVPDYLGFIEKCQSKAKYKIFHIPLDLHVSSVARNAFIKGRYTIGHLHYFSEESALATIRDSGYDIVDSFLTNGGIEVAQKRRNLKRIVARVCLKTIYGCRLWKAC